MAREEQGSQSDSGDRPEREGQGEQVDDGPVTVERLTNIDDTEMYRLFDEEKYRALCTVALRPEKRLHWVEYAVWRKGHDAEQPGATDSLEWRSPGDTWDDAAREDVIRQIAYRYEEDIGVVQKRLAFRFEGPPPEEEAAEEEAGADGDDGDSERGDRGGGGDGGDGEDSE